MPEYPFGKRKIIDKFQRCLDQIEKKWPMTGSYERVEPYIIPCLNGREYFEVLIYHIESKLWFDNYQTNFIMNYIADKQLVLNGDVVFDLGSNAGVITLLLAKLCGSEGHVHAFDPYPWNAAATHWTARLNHFDNVTAHAVGVSNKNCQISVSPNDSRSYESSSAANSQILNIRAINDYMHLKPAFMKLDIEGAEYDVFDGQTPEVFESVRAFVLEFHPMWIRPRGVEPKAVLRSMQTAGFELHLRNRENPAYSVDDYEDRHMLFWANRLAAAATGAGSS